MPNIIDWNDVILQDEFEVYPDKWVSPIIIKHGYRNYNSVYEFCWRIEDSNHTFTIPFKDLNEKSNGDIPGHIQSFLEDFRKDWLKWLYGGLNESWQKEYYEQYKQYIELQ